MVTVEEVVFLFLQQDLCRECVAAAQKTEQRHCGAAAACSSVVHAYLSCFAIAHRRPECSS